MTDPAALERAANRLADIDKRIEAQRARIARLPPGTGRRTAEEVLVSFETSRSLFLEHYRSLGGKSD